MEYINFIWPRNINMSISSCHIFLKCDQEADKNLEYSLNFVRTDLILIFIFEFDTNLLRNKSGQKFVQHGFWAWEGISPFLKIHKKNTWCIAIQNATYWRKTGFDIYKKMKKKIPIPITNKISSSPRISEELRVLKVMPPWRNEEGSTLKNQIFAKSWQKIRNCSNLP